MLKGKDCNAVEMLFPFVAAFIQRKTGCTDELVLTEVHKIYSDLVTI